MTQRRDDAVLSTNDAKNEQLQVAAGYDDCDQEDDSDLYFFDAESGVPQPPPPTSHKESSSWTSLLESASLQLTKALDGGWAYLFPKDNTLKKSDAQTASVPRGKITVAELRMLRQMAVQAAEVSGKSVANVSTGMATGKRSKKRSK